MPCNPMNPVTGGPAGCIVSGVVDIALKHLTAAFSSSLGDVVKSMLTWWVAQPAGNPDQVAIAHLQTLLLPVTAAVAVVSLLFAGISVIVSRKGDPLFHAGTGLLSLAFWSGAGIGAVVLGLKASDALSSYILSSVPDGQLSDRLSSVLSLNGITGLGVVIVLSLVIMLLTGALWVLLFLRLASVVLLVAVLPLAAAGAMTASTKPWLRRVLTWTLGLLAYKIAVAAIFALGFVLVGTGKDLHAVMTGLSILVLALVALPQLMKFFAFAVDQGAPRLAGFSSAITGAAGTAATGAIALGAVRGRAIDQAQHVAGGIPSQPSGATPVAAKGAAQLAGMATQAASRAVASTTDSGSSKETP